MTADLKPDSHDEPLVTLRSFGTEAEAAMAQGLLEENGIPAYVYGGQSATTMSYYGTAVGGVRLEVPKSRTDEATRLLAEELESAEAVPAWTCPACSAEVDAGFAVCWQCGHEYVPAETQSEPSPREAVADDGAADESPYDIGEAPTDERPDEPADLDDVEDFANRAWKSALLSVGVAPLAFYSGYLILKTLGDDLSPSGTRKVMGAAVLSALCTLMWGTVFAYILRLCGFMD